MAAVLLGAALVTGNTVVHKPSERCPRTGRRFAELLAAELPDGVLEIVDGDAAVGARLAAMKQVDVVAHVGGSATGRDIARACADHGAKALLENGGNDPLIVDAGHRRPVGSRAGHARRIRQRRPDLCLGGAHLRRRGGGRCVHRRAGG